MTTAHVEAIAMALFAAVSLTLFLLAIRLRRRTGQTSPLMWPSLFGVVLGLGLMSANLGGVVFVGVGGGR